MSCEKFDKSNPAVVVATLGDIERAGGLVSFEKKKVAVLPLLCHALIDGEACGLFWDERDCKYRVVTICTVTGRMYAKYKISAGQLAHFTERQGIFHTLPAGSTLLNWPPEAA